MRREEAPHLPALSRAERERIRSSREALVKGGLLAAPPGSAGVPRHIERSWRRCVGEAVPVVRDEIDYREPEDNRTTLLRAAEPVLSRLKDSLGDVPVAMVLSDATGRIVVRHAQVRRTLEIMDRAHAAEGFDFSEPSVGTNGIGTVLVERRPVLVRGPEHYNALLEDLTCAGTPIIEPCTGRVVGTFSLACATRDVHPLMTVMAGDVVRQIEARILDEAGDRRRRLVQAYLSVDQASTATLVVDADTVLANRLGLVHAGPELHPLLWRFLDEHGPATAQRMRVPLSDGPHEALVTPIRDCGTTAYSVRLLPGRPDAAGTGGAALPVVVGDVLHFDGQVNRQLETAVRHRELVAVTGASGTGKLYTAVRVLRRRGARDPLVVEPHLQRDWFDQARAAVADRRGVVLRRVHETPAPSVAQVRLLAAPGAPVALTADLDAAGDGVLGLVRQVATTVRLPTLAQCREHLPSLVRAVLAELPEPASATRFASPVWDLLMSWHWPGNLAELRNTVVQLARRAEGGTVEAGDLPDELRTARRGLSMLESAERAAVVEALQAAGGNRSRAARALGIGRNTLYRKMREFGIS
ncbi:sigma-54-dependent Fis family transcriptional regulator [Amycolatopsis thermophila]|uniref:Transcriptional regulator of acetoin/glycerol metabolism n=1 Tax=Amycolatopsis thermophila TaxID=206084 RepID=A0ABU0F2C5_9PSEU|nr:helix-turn-helix domain-containing protein [Amycolatopsis thermophila]MDQ0381321.1 transcriptional regulator of acetoin/glycerol metabolism [Amycolatopsis thermophila]